MAWKANKGTDVLGSIAARLLSLADLAEAVAGRSFLIRWLALWYIWQADAVAREFVAGSEWNTAGRQWSPALPAVRYGTGPADAMALAVSLSALARIVLDMAAQQRRQSSFHTSQGSGEAGDDRNRLAGARREGRTFMRIGRAFALQPVGPHDTS